MSVIQDTLTTTCRNCEVTFEGKFCPNCSQKADTHRFTLGHFAHEVFHAFTHTDKGILFLIKEMFRRPGKVALEYNSGKRKKYFNPITFLLVMTALQVFLISKTGFYQQFAESTEAAIQQWFGASGEFKTSDARMEEMRAQMSMLTDYNKLITLAFIPVLALFTWLFFKKSGHNYAENLVFTVLVNGQLMVLFVPFALIPFLIKPSLVVVWLYLYFLISWAYNIVAYKQFFQQRWGITVLKGIILQVLYMIVIQNTASTLVGFLKRQHINL